MKIFIGYDSREDLASQVCKHSILTHQPSADIHLLKQPQLREQGIYYRSYDSLGSTEFSITRFLVPYINNYQGWALFCDCDFLFLTDIAELFALADDSYAVMCVKHEYTPDKQTKMDGAVQHQYPRKNWSSLVLYNCSHPSNSRLNIELVNNSTGLDLHRFAWLQDNEIGELPLAWNWLVGWNQEPRDGSPKALHYTEGGPWFQQYRQCEYSQLWIQYLNQTLTA